LKAQARLTWLGHSTVLVELDGVRLITDPVLTRRVGHLWRGPVPAFEGPVDAVAVSHLHWDHLHIGSLRQLAAGAVLVVPAGWVRAAAHLGFAAVEAVHVGSIVRIGDIELEATHADHAVSRRLGASADAVGYLIRGSRRIYFAGDTDLFDGMQSLAPDLDVALLPVGGWGPSVPDGHLDAVKAAQALELLRPRVAVPIHWGTFAPFGLARLGGSHDAADDFSHEAALRAPATTVRVLDVGSSLEL
jgi:L-ascorbate metabolism protein UlaG (beta-lactamase superfamily)